MQRLDGKGQLTLLRTWMFTLRMLRWRPVWLFDTNSNCLQPCEDRHGLWQLYMYGRLTFLGWSSVLGRSLKSKLLLFQLAA